jgi:hypothetical protein
MQHTQGFNIPYRWQPLNLTANRQACGVMLLLRMHSAHCQIIKPLLQQCIGIPGAPLTGVYCHLLLQLLGHRLIRGIRCNHKIDSCLRVRRRGLRVAATPHIAQRR